MSSYKYCVSDNLMFVKMLNKKIVIFLVNIVVISVLFSGPVYGENYHVSPSGSDENTGSETDPFKSIQQSVSRLKEGDTLYLREGRYHEEIKIKGLQGTAERPIIIAAYPGESVVLDGTVSVTSISDGKWEKHENGIYKIQLKQDVWQLIVDGDIQTTARWPNAFWHDESIFDLNRWALGNEEDDWNFRRDSNLMGNGVMGNTPDKRLGHNLKDIDFDLTGAIAVLNVANFDTYCFPVASHDIENAKFTYFIPDNMGIFHYPSRDRKKKIIYRFHKYFFEGKLELLDAPTEWHYDKKTKILYYYPVKGKNPLKMDVRGKVQTYAIDIRDSEHIKIKGLDFFGTTMKSIGNLNLVVEDNDFLYPSYSKRVLGDSRSAESTVFYRVERTHPKFRGRFFDPSGVTIRNCTFIAADGDAVKLQGLNNVVENCYFHKIDYSCVDEASDPKIRQIAGNGGTLHTWWSPGVQIRHCTIDLAGEAHAFMSGMHSNRHGTKNVIAYCRASRCGRLQAQDGANFHIWQFDSDHMSIHHNWAHDSFKYLFRFDGIYHSNPHPYLDHGLAYRLVAFDSAKRNFSDAKSGYRDQSNMGILMKGDHHRTYHTTSFDNGGNGNGVGLHIRNGGGGGNMHSDTRNNASVRISGGRGEKDSSKTKINGIVRANWSAFDNKGLTMRDMLRDPDNLDFRPKKGSALIDKGEVIESIADDYKGEIPADFGKYIGKAPDLGAYEYGDENYWIPGYKAPIASTPIPTDGTLTAKKDCDLMWLGGYKAVSHDVYLSTSKKTVKKATRKSKSFKANLENNIYTPKRLKVGKVYYWRVDAVSETSGKVVKGPVWTFKVLKK